MDKFTVVIIKFMVMLSKLAPLLSRLGLLEYDKWERGKKLRILLVGYNGVKNTGSDVRVAGIVEQLEDLLGIENIEITLLTQNTENLKVYYGGRILLQHTSSIYFTDVLRACSRNHLVILCEGSTLKSKFANALTLFFCEAAGIMKAQGKPSIAYGSEAGYMDRFVERAAKDLCSKTYFIARTESSLEIIKELGMAGHLGTDTAWKFHSLSKKDWVMDKLRATGWDGKKPVLGVAVINPFWWPVKPSLFKLVKAFITGDWAFHYQKWYFYSWSDKRRELFENYIAAISGAINEYVKNNDVQVVIIGMEMLDEDACYALKKCLKQEAVVFPARDYDGYELAQLLRSLSVLVTSRYHARVLSMENYVPTVAVSMDERLDNILGELGQSEKLLLKADETHLKEKLLVALEYIGAHRTELSRQIKLKLPYYYGTMDVMGRFLKDFVYKNFRLA